MLVILGLTLSIKYSATARCRILISFDFQSSRYCARIRSTCLWRFLAVSYFCQSFSPWSKSTPNHWIHKDCRWIYWTSLPTWQYDTDQSFVFSVWPRLENFWCKIIHKNTIRAQCYAETDLLSKNLHRHVSSANKSYKSVEIYIHCYVPWAWRRHSTWRTWCLPGCSPPNTPANSPRTQHAHNYMHCPHAQVGSTIIYKLSQITSIKSTQTENINVGIFIFAILFTIPMPDLRFFKLHPKLI